MKVSEKPQIINGIEHMVTTVDGLDRVEINNKLHHLGDQLMKLKMEQDHLIQMRNMIDRQIEISEMDDLFDQMFGGWLTTTSTLRLTSKRAIFVFEYQTIENYELR